MSDIYGSPQERHPHGNAPGPAHRPRRCPHHKALPYCPRPPEARMWETGPYISVGRILRPHLPQTPTRETMPSVFFCSPNAMLCANSQRPMPNFQQGLGTLHSILTFKQVPLSKTYAHWQTAPIFDTQCSSTIPNSNTQCPLSNKSRFTSANAHYPRRHTRGKGRAKPPPRTQKCVSLAAAWCPSSVTSSPRASSPRSHWSSLTRVWRRRFTR